MMVAARDAVDGNIGGDVYWQQQAKMILPILVRQAEAAQPIRYADLGQESNVWHRQLGKPLGCIGYALIDLADEWGEEIPHIQSLVIKKNTGLPSYGFDGFLKEKGYSKLRTREKHALLNEYWAGIFGYPHWSEVLEAFNLPRSSADPSILHKASRTRGSGGEGKEHMDLKEWVRVNPQLVGLALNSPEGVCEHRLPSGDSADVLFERTTKRMIVEVKPSSASQDEIARGLFQCIKYRAILEAESRYLQDGKSCSVYLVLGGRLPACLFALRNSLGVVVVEEIQPPSM